MASPQKGQESSTHGSADAVINGSIGAQTSGDDDFEGFVRTRPEKRESFSKALLQVTMVTLVLGGGLYLYWGQVQIDEEVRAIATEAKALMLRDSATDLFAAETKFKQARELDSDHPYVVAALALLNAQLWFDYGLADRRKESETLTRLVEEWDVEKAERYGARGLIDLGENKHAEVEAYLVEVTNRSGGAPAIYASLGLAQRGLGKMAAARKSLLRAAESEWRNPRHNSWIAQLYFDDGQLRNATKFVKKALDANPDHLLTLVLDARVRIARGEGLKEAQERLDDVLGRGDGALTPRVHALALVGQCELALFDRKFKLAATRAGEAIAALDMPEGHLCKGIAVLGNKPKNPAAFEEIQKGLEMFAFAPRAYHDSAKALLAANRTDESLKIMNLWGEKVPKDAAYYLAFANLLLETGATQEAVKNYEEAIKNDPRAAEALFRLGSISQAANEFDKAIDFYNKAVSAHEAYPEVYEAMGWLYGEQGHWNDALPLFAQALTYFKAKRTDRKKMNKLRNDVGDALGKNRKYRRYKRPWLSESKALIR